MWKTGEFIGRVWRSSEPDVAIVELNAAADPWIPRMKPMVIESIERAAEVVEGADVWIFGHPVAMQSREAVPTPPVTGEGKASLQQTIHNGGLIARTFATWNVTNPHVAEGERVLHVRHDSQTKAPDPETGAMRRVVEPSGMSGGPLCRLVGHEYRLCDIIRAHHAGHLRCEDVYGALALLREHDDDAV